MSRSTKWLAIIAAVGALLRFIPSQTPYLDLDSSIYLLASEDYRTAIMNGSIFSNPLTKQFYTAIEYWPPLYPILSGIIGNAWLSAALFGWLAIFPVFWLGRSLWDEDTGLFAACIMAIHPYLVWFARVPRTETLYIFLASLALWLLLSAKDRGKLDWRSFLGGGCLGLAYCTRFDALGLVPAVLLSCFALRGMKRVFWGACGFFAASLPYLIFIAKLSGGPALMTPDKVLYDTLEGIWTKAHHRPMYDFTTKYGLPGIFNIDPDDPEVKQMLVTQTPALVREGLRRLPHTIASVAKIWEIILVPLAFSLVKIKDRRVWAVGIVLLPSLLMAIFTAWDPNPRYHAFTLLPLSLLAGLGFKEMLNLPAPNKVWMWIIVAVIIPMQLFSAWIIPVIQHFDQRGLTDSCFIELVPGAAQIKMNVIFGAVILGAVVYAMWKRYASTAAFIAAACLAWGAVLPSLSCAGGILRLAIPVSILLLPLVIALYYYMLPSNGKSWGKPLRNTVAVISAIIAISDLLMLEAWGTAHSRLVHCPAASEYLSEVARNYKDDGKSLGFGRKGPIILAYQQVDALRSGCRWQPLLRSRAMKYALEEQKPDYVLLEAPEPNADMSGKNLVVTVPEMEYTGQVELIGSYPAAGGINGAPRWWRLYAVKK